MNVLISVIAVVIGAGGLFGVSKCSRELSNMSVVVKVQQVEDGPLCVVATTDSSTSIDCDWSK